MDSGRLESFSDGVFAVAITLLALNLAVPRPGQGSLSAQLGDNWTGFAAFAVSFLTIGIIWVNHHAVFRNLARIDRTLLFLNLLMLFFVVTIPFATAVVAKWLTRGGADASQATAIYLGVFEGMSISFAGLFWWAVKHEHWKVAMTPAQARSASLRFGMGNIGYIAAIGIAFVNAPVSLLISALVAIYYVFERTPSADTVAAAGSDPR